MEIWVRLIDIIDDELVAAFGMDLASGTVAQMLRLPATADARMVREYRIEIMPLERKLP